MKRVFGLRGGAMMAGGSALVVGVVLAFATPAFAHTADASVTQTCVNGTSQSTVQFNNNFDIPAIVTYTGAVSGSLPLPAMVGSTPGTNSVTVAVTSPGSLNYSVRWDDGVTQGSRSVPLQPINDCLPVSTTAPAVEVSTVPPTTAAAPPTTVDVLPTTLVALPETTAVVAGPSVSESVPTNRPASIAPDRLPATGSSPTAPLIVAVALILVGGMLVVGYKRADRA